MKYLKFIKILTILFTLYLVITFAILPIEVIANSEIQAVIKDLTNSQINDTIDKVNEENVNKKFASLYPIGSIYISTNSTNPSEFIGGTWEAYGQGRALVGVGTNGKYTFTAGSTGTTIGATTNPLGEYTNILTNNEMASHTHAATASGSVSTVFKGETVTSVSSGSHTHTINGSTSLDGSHTHSFSERGKAIVVEGSTGITSYEQGFLANTSGWYVGHRKNAGFIDNAGLHAHTYSISGTSDGSHSHTVVAKGTASSTFTGSSVTSSLVGGSKAHNNIQPYVVTYIWKRVA